MEKNIIAVVQLSATELAVWFNGGTARHYTANELGLEPAQLATVSISDDGTAIVYEDGIVISDEKLLEIGSDFDFVEQEKHGILRSLSTIRREASFSQTRLGEAAGIRQSVISRIEGCEISPQINTLIKLLAPLGKTLAIVDINK